MEAAASLVLLYCVGVLYGTSDATAACEKLERKGHRWRSKIIGQAILNAKLHLLLCDASLNYREQFDKDGRSTHVSVIVELIVRQFQFVEGDRLLHPMRAARRTIGMHVDPGG